MNRDRMNSRGRRSSPSEGGSGGPASPDQGRRERMRGRADGSGPRKNWFVRHKIISTVVLAVIILGGAAVGMLYNDMHNTNILVNSSARDQTQEPATSNPTLSSNTTGSGTTQPGDTSTVAPTATDELPPDYNFPKDVVNILVLGTDAGMDRVGMGARTDCMILVSINQSTNQVSMISIPRDTYVKIYSDKNNHVVGYNRINAAFVYGKGLNGKGIPYAINTISRYLGGNVANVIPVDHYVLFDMDLVVSLVNMVGGVNVNMDTALSRSEKDPANLGPGMQHLTGALALAYARKRHGVTGGDVTRGLHQQQVIVALLQTLEKQHKVSMIPQLYQNLTKYVSTDLSLDMIIRLAYIAKSVDISTVKDYTIPGEGPGLLINGADILVGDQTKKQEVIQEVFGIKIRINADETKSAMLGRINSQFLSGQATINKAVALLNDNVGFYSDSDAQPLRDAISRWKAASAKNNADDMADAQSDVEAEYETLANIIAANKAASATTPPPTDQPTDTPTDTSGTPTDNPTTAPTNTPATKAPTPTPSPSSDGTQQNP